MTVIVFILHVQYIVESKHGTNSKNEIYPDKLIFFKCWNLFRFSKLNYYDLWDTKNYFLSLWIEQIPWRVKLCVISIDVNIKFHVCNFNKYKWLKKQRSIEMTNKSFYSFSPGTPTEKWKTKKKQLRQCQRKEGLIKDGANNWDQINKRNLLPMLVMSRKFKTWTTHQEMKSNGTEPRSKQVTRKSFDGKEKVLAKTAFDA